MIDTVQIEALIRLRQDDDTIARAVGVPAAFVARTRAEKTLLAPYRPAAAAVIATVPGECHWPLGEPADPGFRYCGRAALPGSDYCPDHALDRIAKGAERRGLLEDMEAGR